MKEVKTAQIEKRTRRVVSGIKGIFVVSLCVFGGLSYLQGQPANGDIVKKLPSKPVNQSELLETHRRQIVQRANVIRTKWRPWAFAHRSELQQMLKAGPTDQKAFDKVWEALPAAPTKEKVGFTFHDLMPQENLWVGVGFGWKPRVKARNNPKIILSSDSTKISSKEKKEKSVQGRFQNGEKVDDFRLLRDIVIASTVKGPISTYLWASGRITQRRYRTPKERSASYKVARAEGRNIRLSELFTPHREVVAPYDFLASSSTATRKKSKKNL